MIPMVQEIMSLQESPSGMTQAKTIVKPLFCTFGHSMPQKEKFFLKKHTGNLKPGELDRISQLLPLPFSSRLLEEWVVAGNVPN